MDFGKRLAALRKQRTMTQQALADAVGCHVTMVRRYEAGETQPTLDVIRNMARALSVSADALVFELDERNPVEDLRLQFEAVSQLPPDEQSVVKEVLESLIIKYQTRRWDKARAVAGAVTAPAKVAPVVKATPTKRVAQAGGQR
jgi:transcriptional regulator with XRE-family HTH domain